MSKLISGKEALIALANGDDIQFQDVTDVWHDTHKGLTLDSFDRYKFRLKPKTIKLNNIEVPAPFKPKNGEKVWFLNDDCECGYGCSEEYGPDIYSHFGWWRSEEEIKQVVEALRSVFKPQ